MSRSTQRIDYLHQPCRLILHRYVLWFWINKACDLRTVQLSSVRYALPSWNSCGWRIEPVWRASPSKDFLVETEEQAELANRHDQPMDLNENSWPSEEYLTELKQQANRSNIPFKIVENTRHIDRTEDFRSLEDSFLVRHRLHESIPGAGGLPGSTRSAPFHSVPGTQRPTPRFASCWNILNSSTKQCTRRICPQMNSTVIRVWAWFNGWWFRATRTLFSSRSYDIPLPKFETSTLEEKPIKSGIRRSS